ncbi:37_t:CDS:2 [Ambispora gerdemannii]|uniref:37_t:CDS:1 n=1 Tax=Ambispora gerdemannii TaxID=144530 RepID=A0A9N8Z131_9GLOM|nr:37_t:CDS:2 [Ambispora gerdemannii]
MCKRARLPNSFVVGVEINVNSYQKEPKIFPIPFENTCLKEAWLSDLDNSYTSDTIFYLDGMTMEINSSFESALHFCVETCSLIGFEFEFEITIEDIDPLYKITDRFLIDALQKKIKEYIAAALTPEKAAETLFETVHCWPELKEEVMKYVVENFNDVFKSSGYQKFCKNPDDCPLFHELNTEIFCLISWNLNLFIIES